MDYLKALHENPDLAEEFDSLFDFFLLDELSPRDDAEGRYTFSLPGMAFARDGSGGEYHLLEDGSIGYNGSEGQAGRLAENMDALFSLLVNSICWHDYCNAKEYVDFKTLEEYGQRQRGIILEDVDADSWRRLSDALGMVNFIRLVWAGQAADGASLISLKQRMSDISAEQALLLDKVLENMDDPDLNAQLKALMDEKQAVQDQIQTMEQEAAQSENRMSRMAELREWMAQLEVNLEYNDEQVRMAVEQITAVDVETIHIKFRYPGLEMEKKLT